MQTQQNANEVTDRTNDVRDNLISESQVNIVNDDPSENTEQLSIQKERINYEVVFFVRYKNNPRPSLEEITNLFNNYGAVHHINCPEERNYAFVFMTSLNTTAEHRRTRSTIDRIIQDMKQNPETRFHITVASSNRGTQSQYPKQSQYQQRPFRKYTQRPRSYRYYNDGNNNYDNNYNSGRNSYRTYPKTSNYSHQYDTQSTDKKIRYGDQQERRPYYGDRTDRQTQKTNSQFRGSRQEARGPGTYQSRMTLSEDGNQRQNTFRRQNKEPNQTIETAEN